MDYLIEHKKKEQKDRQKSAVITLLTSLLLFLLIFFYKFTKFIPKTEETVTTMLINFGDNRNGDGLEEPANQEGSLAAVAKPEISEPQPKPQPKPAEPVKRETPVKKEAPKEKIITGTNAKTSAAKPQKKASASTPKTTASKSTNSKTSTSKATTAISKTGTGDGKGAATVGNLLKGRGTKPGTQGTGGTAGNSGDPLGGEGNGDSKIGVDRRLIAFIPGTMGRGGSQPAHSCSSSGTINIAYTVDKAGNVISAKRIGGISDACAVSTTVSWVKKYVKAEKSSSSSTGTYQITF